MKSDPGGAPWDYVYTEHRTAFGRFSCTTLYRVIKITPNRVFIDRSTDFPQGWRGFGIRMVLTLNRQELEREGRAWSNSQRRFYYAVPAGCNPDGEDDDPPAFIAKLELVVPFTLEDVHRAYRRKAKRMHPDRGGNLEEFLALQASYENALAFFRRA